ncbi:hypothetical protein [Bacillus sp. JCM 19041]|uniref:hypothetical protein n=1 Tax=Bacillus sp. JCM 19041 TaxID=1460637 RepID=UPI00336A883D
MILNGDVQKMENQSDLRTIRLKLTKKGMEIEVKVRQVESMLYQSLDKLYSEEELKVLNQLLRTYIKDSPFVDT